jgi:hypothetical protein
MTRLTPLALLLAAALASPLPALALSLSSKNPSLDVNITPKGAQDAMFTSSVQGSKACVELPAHGTYVAQVLLMRHASRRNVSAPFS